MKMEQVYESAVETAKKIRKTLKAAFPGVKFSVTSSTYSMGSSVYASWTDGPMSSQVDEILNRFKSGSFDGMQDMYISTGYVWEGKVYSGAKYVSGSRKLSEQRRAMILDRLSATCEADWHGDYRVYEWNQAEQELIDAGKLQGHPSQLPQPVVIADIQEPDPAPIAAEEPASRMRPAGKVIAFPLAAVRDPAKAAELQAERLMQSLTPEQRLKLQVLQTMFGNEEVARMLRAGTLTIDEIFRVTAERIFN